MAEVVTEYQIDRRRYYGPLTQNISHSLYLQQIHHPQEAEKNAENQKDFQSHYGVFSDRVLFRGIVVHRRCVGGIVALLCLGSRH